MARGLVGYLRCVCFHCVTFCRSISNTGSQPVEFRGFLSRHAGMENLFFARVPKWQREDVGYPPSRDLNDVKGGDMRRWWSLRTAIIIAWSLIGIGVLPFICLLLWAKAHPSQAVSERVSLLRGEFVSPYFRPELDGNYQINLYWPKFPSRETQVDLDWRIVDSQGLLIDQGTYNSGLEGANIVQLGEYHPERGVRQRIILNVHRDVIGSDGEARLEIGIPEVGLDRAEGAYPLAVGWAAITAIPGALVLAVIWFLRKY